MKPFFSSRLFFLNKYADAHGTTVKLTIRDIIKATVTVITKSRKSNEAIPFIKKKGTIAAMLVKVEAIKALITSLLPLCEACMKLRVPFWCLVMFSNITTELSTSIPTAKTSPPREKIFKVTPNNPIKIKVPQILTGIAIAITNVLRILCKKNQMAIIANMAPIIADELTLDMEFSI